MTVWTSEELNKIGTAEELQIASLRADGSLRSSRTRTRPASSSPEPP